MTSTSTPLPELLTQRLRQPLPGRAAQGRFEPELGYGRHYDRPASDARLAAVAMLLYPGEDGWRLPLVLRPGTMADHAGQIGLPGGLIEPGETSQQAALRELEEELGVPAGDVQLLGSLTPLYLFVSHFYLTPWVTAVAARPVFRPSADEVAEVIELPVALLLDPASAGRHRREERGIAFSTPHWSCGQHRIWGATAMLLGELAAVLAEVAA